MSLFVHEYKSYSETERNRNNDGMQGTKYPFVVPKVLINTLDTTMVSTIKPFKHNVALTFVFLAFLHE